MADLQESTRFDPAEVEPRILARWLESGFVHPEPGGSAEENFSLAIPPPNVTGALHMGHALNGTIQDVLVRTNRMRGRSTTAGSPRFARRSRDTHRLKAP